MINAADAHANRPSVPCGLKRSGGCHVGCCVVPLSDDDEHNTGNPLLLLCAHDFVAPALLPAFAELGWLSVVLSCRFAPDIWTIMQQEYPLCRSGVQRVQRFTGSAEVRRSWRARQAFRPRRQHGWTCLSGCALSSFSPVVPQR